MAEVQPKFVGGTKAFAKYLRQNLKVKHKNRGQAEGKIFVEFIVEKNGTLSHAKIIRNMENVETNIIEVLENSSTWIAGTQRGKKVRVKMSIPILIHPEKEAVDESISSLFENNTNENTYFYPNPATDLGNIKVVLGKETEVRIVVFDSNLQEIAVLQDSKRLEKGTHLFEWNTEKVSNGMYFIYIQKGNEKITKRVVVQH